MQSAAGPGRSHAPASARADTSSRRSCAGAASSCSQDALSYACSNLRSTRYLRMASLQRRRERTSSRPVSRMAALLSPAAATSVSA